MTEPLRVQLVHAVRNHDSAALDRLYDQINVFAQKSPEKHARLPEPLRRHAAARSAPTILKSEWEEHHHTSTEKGEDPGPALWPLWSHAPPPSAAPAARRDAHRDSAALRALARKYAKRKKQVHHFEKWYTDFEATNREVVEQLNEVYRRIRASKGHATPPETPWLPLDDVAVALLDMTEPEQAGSGGNTKS